ncbi:hypothetical protein RFI_11381 [Reticulomyxa filosa]|uniref:Uncharacterized protein n=1 Tax=Reticulomyxa filosa TaxID=46433 RepID=X6NHF9_RETFI|nr:hypothetical protein RFI_11381 [Reticulomyxa filosa]|eukprot:ETO25760.1 hypothetical protein RFI_11381 [Reticulomyxa filosa]
MRSKGDEKKEDSQIIHPNKKYLKKQKSFDLEPLVVACRDLIGRSNIIYDTVFNRKDFTLVDKVYGELSSENPKSKQLSDNKHPDELARTLVQKLLAGSLRSAFPNITVCGDEGSVDYSAHDIVVPQKSTFEKTFQTQLEFPKSLKALNPREITIWIGIIIIFFCTKGGGDVKKKKKF